MLEDKLVEDRDPKHSDISDAELVVVNWTHLIHNERKYHNAEGSAYLGCIQCHIFAWYTEKDQCPKPLCYFCKTDSPLSMHRLQSNYAQLHNRV